jgi:hypothetical protein
LRLKVFFHDRCFDGTASAALFGRFYGDVITRGTVLQPVGVRHRDGDPFEGVAFDADDHACVDFRFSPDPQMHWWFDHHRTAFQPPALRAIFEARRSPTQWFDPDAPSCTGLIARVLADRWGWTPPAGLSELVRWADIIDAAHFGSAAEATSLAEPAQRLAVFLGAAPDDASIDRYIQALAEGMTLAQLDAEPWVQAVLAPVIAGREETAHVLASLGRVVLGAEGDPDGELAIFDLLDHPGVPSPGFIGYQLFPRCRYTVAATRAHGSIKIAVGHNPWGGFPLRHDVGAICQALGGGGHAVVGGVTLAPEETSRARATIEAIVAALKRPAP